MSMKTVNNSLMRIIFAMIIGLVLVVWPDAAANYMAITIGILFIIPGIISTVGCFANKNMPELSTRFPIEAVGSILLGLWLVIMPDFFVNILMFLLGFILIMAGIQQIASLFSARKWVRVPGLFYVIPVLILLAGITVLLNPGETLKTTFVIIGITCLVYAIAELINWFKFLRLKPQNKMIAPVEDAEIIEDEA